MQVYTEKQKMLRWDENYLHSVPPYELQTKPWNELVFGGKYQIFLPIL